MTSPIKFVEGPAPTAVPAPTAIPAQIGEAGHPPRSRVADSESARGTLAGEAVCVETGACVHSEVVFPDGVDCGLPQAQSTSREKLAGRRADAQGEADGVASRRRNCQSRTQPQPPGSSKEQQSSHACRDHTSPPRGALERRVSATPSSFAAATAKTRPPRESSAPEWRSAWMAMKSIVILHADLGVILGRRVDGGR